MVKLQTSQSNSSSYFELGGVDYKKGLYIPFYTSIEKESSGKINERKIKIGLKHSENNSEIQEPVGVGSYVDSNNIPFKDLKNLLIYLVSLIGDSSEGGAFDAASLPNSEVVTLANLLASLENGYIEYYTSQIGDNRFKIAVESTAPEQVITLAGENNNSTKQYFTGDAPYTIKVAEDFPITGLGTTEYYQLYYRISDNYGIKKFIGNNLGTVAAGFEFGTPDSLRFYFQVSKSNQGQVISIVNTNIVFNNNTTEDIKYKPKAANWGTTPKTGNFTTDHYNRWDDLYFSYTIDLTDSTQAVKFDIYNNDTGQLIRTATAQAGQNQTSLWGGGQVSAVRNVRIEANYI